MTHPLYNKFNLGFFPTPLHQLENLSRQYPGYKIYIKRDDNTGLALGGNKVRKLEYLIKDALNQGCDTVITAGAQQSNHCRQTAAACAQAGLECHLLLGGHRPQQFNGNLLLSHLLGANIHFTGDKRKGEDSLLLKEKLENEGKKCCLIPYGGSNYTGALGYVQATRELKLQLDALGQDMNYIFFASSSGGMQAGLMLGMEMFGLDTTLMPVNIDKEPLDGHQLDYHVLQLVREGCERLGLSRRYEPSDIPVLMGYDTPGYGNLTAPERSTLHSLAQTEGILLDPVYTVRAFYAMLDHLEHRRIPAGTNILFWHSGGYPALFANAEKLSDQS
jgi:D-cysteine desulfhydrase family pyridoxal phosphate-dependent enzyme